MLSRPLPPFRVRPLRLNPARKLLATDLLALFADEAPRTVKASRRHVRATKLSRTPELRVAGRSATRGL